jgi:hypothetical protein
MTSYFKINSNIIFHYYQLYYFKKKTGLFPIYGTRGRKQRVPPKRQTKRFPSLIFDFSENIIFILFFYLLHQGASKFKFKLVILYSLFK